MNGNLRTSASGMAAQQQMIEVIANNLANVNTSAFKRSRAAFEDVLYQTAAAGRVLENPAGEATGPMQIGSGVRLASVLRIHQQGVLQTTDRPLDLAIEGEGFLEVLRPDGTTAYTRDGSLTLSESGTLMTSSGYPLAPEIVIPEDASEVAVSPSGVVSVSSGGSSSAVEVGRIELARFLNPTGLAALGENQYAETPASGRPLVGYPQEDGFGRLTQGALEASNVDVVQEMTDMISAQRAYEINARAIQAGDEMMRAANDILR
jgi:flagellar basal-body rod protein FlgG